MVPVAPLADSLHADSLHQGLHQLALDLPRQRLIQPVAELPEQRGGGVDLRFKRRRLGRLGLVARDLLPKPGLLRGEVVKLVVQGRDVDPPTAVEPHDQVALGLLGVQGGLERGEFALGLGPGPRLAP